MNLYLVFHLLTQIVSTIHICFHILNKWILHIYFCQTHVMMDLEHIISHIALCMCVVGPSHISCIMLKFDLKCEHIISQMAIDISKFVLVFISIYWISSDKLIWLYDECNKFQWSVSKEIDNFLDDILWLIVIIYLDIKFSNNFHIPNIQVVAWSAHFA